MRRIVISIIVSVITIYSTELQAQCWVGSCTYTYNGGACSNITLNAGETLCIRSGIFNCQVTYNGGTVYVAPGAQFTPVNSNNVTGTITNCGYINYSSATFTTGVELANYGRVDFNVSTNFWGGNYDNFGTINHFTQAVLEGSSLWNNQGTINASSEFIVRHAGFVNNNDVFIGGNFVAETTDANVRNNGRIIADNNININPGASVYNFCSFIARANIVLDEDIVNSGIILGNGATSQFTINSTATVVNDGDMISQNMLNSGTILGSGRVYIYESTTQNSGASTGTDGWGLNFYDFTSSGQTYDTQQGVVDPSVTNTPPVDPAAIPDEGDLPIDCSLEPLIEPCNEHSSNYSSGTNLTLGASPVFESGATQPILHFNNISNGQITKYAWENNLGQTGESFTKTGAVVRLDNINAGNYSGRITMIFNTPVNNLVFDLGDIDNNGGAEQIDIRAYNGASAVPINSSNFSHIGPNVLYSYPNSVISNSLPVPNSATSNSVRVNIPEVITRVELDLIGTGDDVYFYITQVAYCSAEFCNDGVDNDGDGYIDCSDCEDCRTSVSCDDADGDGISDLCDIDDDNDGIPDIDECPDMISAGSTGAITGFSFDIASSDPDDIYTSHVLNSITVGGTTYSDFIAPDSYSSMFTVANNSGVRFTQNGVGNVFDLNSPTYDQDIIIAFQSRNLNAYQSVDFNNFSDGDYYDLGYNNPIVSTGGGFIIVTERLGNNPQVINALDDNGNVIGRTLQVNTTDYVNTFHNVIYNAGETQYAHFAVYPVEDLAPIGTPIYGLRVSFGPTAFNDGPDAKVFFFGDLSLVSCDCDNDGVINPLDLDSDNDGIYDVVEAGHERSHTNGRLITDVGNNGLVNALETSSDSDIINYSIADSEISPDGLYDICEIDSDGDGCYDTIESQASSNDDTDGLAGPTIPTVDGFGRVNGQTYQDPPTNAWQDFMNNFCQVCRVALTNPHIMYYRRSN